MTNLFLASLLAASTFAFAGGNDKGGKFKSINPVRVNTAACSPADCKPGGACKPSDCKPGGACTPADCKPGACKPQRTSKVAPAAAPVAARQPGHAGGCAGGLRGQRPVARVDPGDVGRAHRTPVASRAAPLSAQRRVTSARCRRISAS